LKVEEGRLKMIVEDWRCKMEDERWNMEDDR